MIVNMLDYINAKIEAARNGKELTYEEWCEIRRNGTPEEIEDAVEKMMAQGGYENLA